MSTKAEIRLLTQLISINFETHINNTIAKISSKVGLLLRIRSHISRELAKALHLSLIQPHFTYGNFLLYGVTRKLKGALQVQQNAAIRAVMNVDLACSTSAFYTELGLEWLDILACKSAVNWIIKALWS